MFIRTRKNSEIDHEKQIEQELKENYELDDLEVETFKSNERSVLLYKFQGLYNHEEVSIHDFYVVLNQRMVEFTFYSPANSNDTKQVELFKQSVTTLNEEKSTEAKTSESMEENTDLKIENDAVSFTLTGYKMITGTEEKRLLIIRYLFLNKQTEPSMPNIWNSIVTAKQDGQALTVSSITESEEVSDLSYLLQVGKTAIGKGDLVQTAVVYELPDSSMSDISFTFDQATFKDQTPIILPIKE